MALRGLRQSVWFEWKAPPIVPSMSRVGQALRGDDGAMMTGLRHSTGQQHAKAERARPYYKAEEIWPFMDLGDRNAIREPVATCGIPASARVRSTCRTGVARG